MNNLKRSAATKYQSVANKCVTFFFTSVRRYRLHIMLIYAMTQNSTVEIDMRYYKWFLAVQTNENIIHNIITITYNNIILLLVVVDCRYILILILILNKLTNHRYRLVADLKSLTNHSNANFLFFL